MAVTLKQIRDKREELRVLSEKKVAAGKSWKLTRDLADTLNNEYVALIHRVDAEEANLRALGAAFALDEGESYTQDKLNLPEPEESPENEISPFKPGAMSFGVHTFEDDIPF